MLSSQLKRRYDAEFSECLASSKLAMSREDRRALAILENSARLVDGHCNWLNYPGVIDQLL